MTQTRTIVLRNLFLVLTTTAFVIGLTSCATREVVVERETSPRAVVVESAPPPPREEVVYAAPSREHVWIPGHWVRRGNHWDWYEGYWEYPPRQRAQWIPGRWERHRSGWVWIEGSWRVR